MANDSKSTFLRYIGTTSYVQGKDGQPELHVGFSALATAEDLHTATNGKKAMDLSVYLNGIGQTLCQFFGPAAEPNDKGNVVVKVSLWTYDAERVDEEASKHPDRLVQVSLAGALTPRYWNDKNTGNQRCGLKLTSVFLGAARAVTPKQQDNGAPQGYGYGAPPQSGYGAPPQGGYGAPPQGSYGAPPQGGYGAPPQGGYGAPPQGGYGAPPQGGYGAPPQGGYGAPPQGSYGAPPQGSYGTPQQGAYGAAPQGTYGTPPQGSANAASQQRKNTPAPQGGYPQQNAKAPAPAANGYGSQAGQYQDFAQIDDDGELPF